MNTNCMATQQLLLHHLRLEVEPSDWMIEVDTLEVTRDVHYAVAYLDFIPGGGVQFFGVKGGCNCMAHGEATCLLGNSGACSKRKFCKIWSNFGLFGGNFAKMV